MPLIAHLDQAVQNLHPTYAFQINRREINSFQDLLSIGKQVEVKLLNMKQYKEPPLPEATLLTNAAYVRPKEDQPAQKKIPDKNDKRKIAATQEAQQVDAMVASQQTAKPSAKTPQKKNTTNTVSQTSEEHSEMPKPGQCFQCRKEGHSHKNCRSKKLFKCFCYGCGRANIIKPRCPTCNPPKKENKEGSQ